MRFGALAGLRFGKGAFHWRLRRPRQRPIAPGSPPSASRGAPPAENGAIRPFDRRAFFGLPRARMKAIGCQVARLGASGKMRDGAFLTASVLLEARGCPGRRVGERLAFRGVGPECAGASRSALRPEGRGRSPRRVRRSHAGARERAALHRTIAPMFPALARPLLFFGKVLDGRRAPPFP